MLEICLTDGCAFTPVPDMKFCISCLHKPYNRLHLEQNQSKDPLNLLGLLKSSKEPDKPQELTGFTSSYYQVQIDSPNAADKPYIAECGDIIEALGMDFNDGCAFKAIWRANAAKNGMKKKGNDNPLYDREKAAFYTDRALQQAKLRQAHLTNAANDEAHKNPGKS